MAPTGLVNWLTNGLVQPVGVWDLRALGDGFTVKFMKHLQRSAPLQILHRAKVNMEYLYAAEITLLATAITNVTTYSLVEPSKTTTPSMHHSSKIQSIVQSRKSNLEL